MEWIQLEDLAFCSRLWKLTLWWYILSHLQKLYFNSKSVSSLYVHLNGTLKIECEHSFLQWQKMGWIYFCNLSGFAPYSGGSYDDGTSESRDRWRWLLIGHTNYSRHVSPVQCIRIHHHTTVCMVIGVGNLFGKSYKSKTDFSIDFLDIGITILCDIWTGNDWWCL